jgi:hypothetical protein
VRACTGPLAVPRVLTRHYFSTRCATITPTPTSPIQASTQK